MPKNNDFEEKMNSLKLSYSYNDDILGYKIKIEDSSKAKDLLKQFDEYILDFEVLKGNMDDVFLNVTGKNIVIGEENEKK